MTKTFKDVGIVLVRPNGSAFLWTEDLRHAVVAYAFWRRRVALNIDDFDFDREYSRMLDDGWTARKASIEIEYLDEPPTKPKRKANEAIPKRRIERHHDFPSADFGRRVKNVRSASGS